MKFLKRICSRLNRFLSPQPGKNGSSMAFVMIIGAVLVIWVLAIMPLMVAVGNNSLTLQGSYADYLQSRSAIEFCKGELEKMVESKPPYTFCVVQNADGTYTPIPKMESGSLVTAYDTAVNRDPDSTGNIVDDTDTDDIPMESADGKKIVAICAVAQDTQEDNVYHITITTYNNGTKNLTYTADYTIRGSLLINPESYLKSQALPLSDFVVVDGKLGGNTLWNSNIHKIAAEDFNNVTDLASITESFLPYVAGWRPGDGYADSGVFPAVFKTTVLPYGSGSADSGETGGSENGSSVITTDDNIGWIVPNPVNNNIYNNQKKDGYIWYTVSGNSISIQMRLNGNDIDITDLCTVYYNGKTGFPSGSLYQVSIDFSGYESEDGNVLPVSGLTLPTLLERSVQTHAQPNVTAKITKNGNSITATFSGDTTGVLFGYCTSNGVIQSWTSNTTITISDVNNKAYFFYAYRPASVDENGVFYSASAVKPVGTNANIYATALESGKQYLIVNADGYAMYYDANGKIKSSALNIDDYLSNPSNYNNYVWKATYDYWSEGYSFTCLRDNNNSLSFDMWNSRYNLSWQATNFTVSFSGTNAAVSYKDWWDNTYYMNIGSGNVTASTSTSYVKFIPIDGIQTKVDPPIVSAPATHDNDYAINYSQPLTNIITQIKQDLRADEVENLNVNGKLANSSVSSGKYHLTATVNGFSTYVGTLTVNKATLNNTLQFSGSPNGEESTISWSVKNAHTDTGGILWVGYKLKGSNSEYKWFLGTQTTFTLPYGTYLFKVKESISFNYCELETDAKEIELSDTENDGSGEEGGSGSNDGDASMMMGSSLYFMGREGSIDTEGNTIYLTTDLLVMRHDILGDGKVYVFPYSNEQNYDESAADTLFFVVNDMKNAAGFEFKGRTFYWIPAGTDINHATADDLNFANRPALSLDRGADFDKLKILLRKGDYPEINMDIAYIDRENKADKVDAETGEPSNEQLAHIVSGETIGWTNNGRMENGDDRNSSNNSSLNNANSKFIVCAYVTSVKDAEIKRTANRIMLAAEETLEGGYESKTLRVTNNLHFTCRYISISADYIIQNGNNNYFKIKNLGQDQTFIGKILSFFGIDNYSSKTMQIEFEQTVCIQNKSGVLLSRQKPAGIYRIEHPDLDNDSDEGVNLFQSYANPDSDYTAPALTVKYTNDEIKDLFNRALSLKSRFVERYISIDGGDTNYLEVSLIIKRELYIYANYISFENDIVGYKLKGWIRDGAIIINSQERGYAAEYTGFFGGGSAESYNGTIIHIASNDENSTREKNGIYVEDTFLPAGFYYIPASKDGTNINKLAEVADKEYGTIADIDKIHRINPAELPKYSIYIDPKTGTLSDAYVDTGLIGNSNLGESGFSGGNVG